MERAIEFYERSLAGAFIENEHVLTQLINCYYKFKEYEKVLPLTKKIYGSLKFNRSSTHVKYAISLDYTGHLESVEKEFLSMKARYANFEARYKYGLFLKRHNRLAKALQIFNDLLGENSCLIPRERRSNDNWYELTRAEMKTMKEKAATGA